MRFLFLLLALAAPAPARAQVVACPAGTPPEPCAAEAPLRSAEARLRGAESSLSRVTPRPVTVAQRAAAARAALPGERPSDHAERLIAEAEDMDEATRMDRAVRAAGRRAGCVEGPRNCRPHPPGIPRPATWETRCFSAALSGCRVVVAGLLNGEGAGRLLFQVQAGHTEKDGIRAGVVVLEGSGGGWVPVAWAFEGVTYGAPTFVVADGDPLLFIPGRRGGSTGGNAEMLFRRVPGGFREIGLSGWQAGLAARLPDGLELRGPVDYDMRRLTARTRLWRPDDANCCATGGWATLRFGLEGDALRLDEVRLDGVPPR